LRSNSTLQKAVQGGINALASNRDILHKEIQSAFGDSLDHAHPNDPRWDYLLGHTPSCALVGIEVHPARTDQVSAVIKKRQAALRQLRPHLMDGRCVDRWLWVASGSVQILDLDKERQRLDQRGITFVRRQVLARHLPRTATG